MGFTRGGLRLVFTTMPKRVSWSSISRSCAAGFDPHSRTLVGTTMRAAEMTISHDSVNT
jgi:hypothetical protein